MPINPVVVNELRTMFKSGATPSALIRRIAECHANEPRLDHLVRPYFRDAFHVPMLHVGPEQVKQIAEGGSLPMLNATTLHRMVQTRPEWDRADSSDGSSRKTWLDLALEAGNSAMAAAADPKAIPELATSWNMIDDDAREFIRRLIGLSHSMHEQVHILAVLAERLQMQAEAAFHLLDQERIRRTQTIALFSTPR